MGRQSWVFSQEIASGWYPERLVTAEARKNRWKTNSWYASGPSPAREDIFPGCARCGRGKTQKLIIDLKSHSHLERGKMDIHTRCRELTSAGELTPGMWATPGMGHCHLAGELIQIHTRHWEITSAGGALTKCWGAHTRLGGTSGTGSSFQLVSLTPDEGISPQVWVICPRCRELAQIWRANTGFWKLSPSVRS